MASKMDDKNYCPECDAFLPNDPHKPMCMFANNILVPRKDYDTLLHTVQDLKEKYADIVNDKRRWRNYAILGSATHMLVTGHCHLRVDAINAAEAVLTMIEGVNNVEPGFVR